MSVRRCWSLGYWTGYNSLERSQKLVHIFVLTGDSRLLVLAKAMVKTCMGQEVKQVNALSNNIGLLLDWFPARKVNNKLVNGGCNNLILAVSHCIVGIHYWLQLACIQY